MTAGHLIASSDLAALRYGYPHHHIDAGREIGIVFTGEHFHVNHFTAFAMRHAQRGVFDIARFLAKDRPQQAFFWGQLFFTLRRDLAYQDIIRPNFRTDADDTVIIQVLDGIIADIRNITRDLFRSQPGVARFNLVFLNVHRCKSIILHQFLRDQDGIFKVTTFPRQESHHHVLPKRQLTTFCGRRIGHHITLADDLAFDNCRALVDAGRLV